VDGLKTEGKSNQECYEPPGIGHAIH
jgi:hypothetical protein